MNYSKYLSILDDLKITGNKAFVKEMEFLTFASFLDNKEVKEISINSFDNVFIGNAQDYKAGTGVSAFIFSNNVNAGISIKGGASASRNVSFLNNSNLINCIILGGGSVFGLSSYDGALKWLTDKNINPLIYQSNISDLNLGDIDLRNYPVLGFKACQNALKNNYKDGCYGAGTGASVSKLAGFNYAIKSGIGSFALEYNDLKIGAISVVNAIGDIYSYSGKQLTGPVFNKKLQNIKTNESKFIGNTTISVILTNAELNKSQLIKLASKGQNAYSRSIIPVHTSDDGYTVYSVSLGDYKANLSLLNFLASQVVSLAIEKAIRSSISLYNLSNYKEFYS